jgi:protein transport protein SEC39
MAATQRIEALLKATHTLSEYRLVLKQGEPFTPVMLRVHSDPISIVAKVLEQNPRSYTRIQDMLDLGSHIVGAGLTVKDKSGLSTLTPEQEPKQRSIAERRITAMCIDAALTEDDFETAYSYIVNRLAALPPPTKGRSATQSRSSTSQSEIQDDWSWKAALQAGKYRRTSVPSSFNSKTKTRSTAHGGGGGGGLGTSANPEIRHLEQRIECLSTALRIAPTPTLQEILNAFRRCEEELDAKTRAEAEREEEWDAQGDSIVAGRDRMPGGFSPEASRTDLSGSNAKRSGRAAGRAAGGASADDTPMSLFDLSRASARAAQRNLTALSNLQQSIMARAPASSAPTPADSEGVDAQGNQQRTRKRDQLRDAAMGAMVSGVGWLVGAQPAERRDDAD